MAVFSEAQRRLAHEQAAASARISGHVPTPEFEADCEAVIVGASMAMSMSEWSLKSPRAREPNK